ncbi:hypothetical protein [Vibrio gallaecicus]|uniref:Pilus assembly protein n=1 Tax=Vibrio gallaecicus TaxID=552386 RepID=A0ABV4NDS9_9VIBR
MNKMKQKGAISLLVTSVLLLSALIVSFGMYRGVFHQIKVAQNEVKAKKVHWVLEGGVECGFSLVNEANSTTVNESVCEGAMSELESLDVVVGIPNKIIATNGNSTISKAFKLSGSSASGAMKSSSNVYFAGGYSAYPDPGVSAGGNKWECTILRYRDKLKVFGAVVNQTLVDSVPPYNGFPTGQSCLNSHYTSGAIGNHDLPPGLKSDFIKDSTFEPFEDLFGTPREQWLDVMYDSNFDRIGTSLPASKPDNKNDLPVAAFSASCGSDIEASITNGNDLIWVYGGCHLDDSALTAIDNAIAGHASDGVILLIHNGILSTSGSHEFKGMLYHFVSGSMNSSLEYIPDYTPSDSDWQSTGTVQYSNLVGVVDHTPSHLPDVSVTDVSYYQDGAFNPLGGYVMDFPDTYAVFRSSMSFTYNKDVIDGPLGKLRKTRWIEGSWNDL